MLHVGRFFAHLRTSVRGGGGVVAGGVASLQLPGTPGLGGGERGPSPVGWLGHPARPVGSHHPSKTGLGGTGAQPRGWSEPPVRPVGSHLPSKTERTGPGGAGSPAQGVVGASYKAHGGPSAPENWAHRPRGDGESSPGGVQSLLQGQWGAIFCREPGAPAWGARGAQPRGCSEPPARPMGGHYFRRTGRLGPSSSENRAHRPGGDVESCPGGVRSLLQG